MSQSYWILRSVPAVVILLSAGCGPLTPRRPPPRAEESAASHKRPAATDATHAPPAPLEEGEAGSASQLAPPAIATPPDALAALPPSSPEAMEAPSTSAEPQSLLGRIGPTTPPNVAAALRLIEDGRQQLNDGRAEQALERFERAVAIDPTNAYGYYFLAQLHYLKKHYDQAIAFASRAVVLSARTDQVWLGRAYSLQGAVFEEVGRYPDARKAYRKAVEADPNNLAARVGVARLNLGE